MKGFNGVHQEVGQFILDLIKESFKSDGGKSFSRSCDKTFWGSYENKDQFSFNAFMDGLCLKGGFAVLISLLSLEY